ncbi:MAG: hypothetical protein ACD_30C00028G0012 [uncultured bacterium]|uniref:nucleoside-diphosphate kinase n=3 Tax=Candidatus Daviesiibacteriota TaxID=1752718 RepID=A0A0G0I126_9BACT|nr:MAG: hypothetical protein ACD_30C00028G0012 [uncultured bacterium]KKQ09811.1 MAG: Nucleoside diphosphate kinase [Candidatus Daviesbacteria bacterium GW2011_GWB1_36_5]KKQ14067.1 MAG: Nucleoside diphosphate kinase [Candidatus Daviesbacteria bacterium GW2011_GWA1_36_8]OGE32287.1 MAG: hypothetical protein A3C99_03430 [Candidatus Daviesbacteria bacterium RIFCSPHIGHO2_02_FULL_37_9]OGE35580.1 MAG: hypothetical protein A3E66_02390 [Candidatus Daviesbacteria bacterium RIFCSPHIGHO2_12_FULL_37_16]
MNQRTLILLKPDAVKKNLVGEIIKRYEDAGLKVVELQMLKAPMEIVSKHYPEDEEYLRAIGEKSVQAGEKVDDTLAQGKMVVGWLRDFITSGPIVAMVLEGEDAVTLARKVTGYTDPQAADKGSIRGDLGEDSILKANAEKRPVYNLIHASGTKEEAEHEISLWFPS